MGLALGHIVLAAALVVRAELVTLTLPVGVEALCTAAHAGLCGEEVLVGMAKPGPPLPTLHWPEQPPIPSCTLVSQNNAGQQG